MFFRLSLVSLHKKKKIFRTPEDSSQSLSFALRSSEYTHIKDHHGAFCDDDDIDELMQLLFFLFFFVFVALISLSLSLSLSLSSFSCENEDFLKSGKRVNGLFLRLRPRQFLKYIMSFVRVFVSRAKDKTDERLIAFMFVCVCVYIN